MEKTQKKTLTVPRQKELKKEFPDGKAVGRAFVQFFLDRKRKRKEPGFIPALTAIEMKFLRKTVYAPLDQELFKPYYILEKVLRQFVYWIDHYEHVYYHGLFRDLSVIQTPDYDIRIYHLLKSQACINEEEIEKAKIQYTQTLIPIVDILIPNWKGMIAYPLKELYKYSFRLEKIQGIMNFDFSCIMPDMKHHEIEVRELQRIAKLFRNNIENYIINNNFEINKEAIEKLDNFIQIDIDNIKLNEEEKEENTQKAISTVNMIKGG